MTSKIRNKISGDIVFALIITVLGIIWTISGILTGLWDRIAPAGGFMLTLIGAPLIILGLSLTVKQVKAVAVTIAMNEKEKKVLLYVIAACVIGVVLMSFILGTFATLAVFILLWLRFYAGFSWWKTILASAIIILAIYGMFVVWLQVRFPTFLDLGII